MWYTTPKIIGTEFVIVRRYIPRSYDTGPRVTLVSGRLYSATKSKESCPEAGKRQSFSAQLTKRPVDAASD